MPEMRLFVARRLPVVIDTVSWLVDREDTFESKYVQRQAAVCPTPIFTRYLLLAN